MIVALVVGRRCLRPLHVIIYDNKNKGFFGNSIISLKYMRSVKMRSRLLNPNWMRNSVPEFLLHGFL